MRATTQQLKDILGKRVKFNKHGHNQYKDSMVIGIVVGVYLEHPCQEKELKVYSDQTGKYTYRLLSEVTPVETVQALAFRDKKTGQLAWFPVVGAVLTVDARYTREPKYDMEKEV